MALDFEKKSGKMSYPIEDYTPPYRQSKHDLKSSYAWDGLLSRSDVLAAPVKAFRHVSLLLFIFKVFCNFSEKKYFFDTNLYENNYSNDKLVCRFSKGF